MKPVYCLLLILSAFSAANAAEPAWWTQQKRDCGLPASLAYNDWVAQGSPCNSGSKGSAGSSLDDEAVRALGSAIGQLLVRKMFGIGNPGAVEDPAARARFYNLTAEQKSMLIAAVKAQAAEDAATEKRLKLVTEGTAGGFVLRDLDSKPTPLPAQSVAKPSTTLEFGDPMVVDLRSTPSDLPKDLFRDAVADTPRGKTAVGSMGAKDLARLEKDLRERLAGETDPRTKAWLEAQLGWTLNQKGDTAGAIAAIKEAGALDPGSPMLVLLSSAASADTKEKLADTVFAAQEYLKTHPGNRVATAILAEADANLQKATSQAATNGVPSAATNGVASAPTVSPAQQNQLPLIPFAQQGQHSTAELAGSDEAVKAGAGENFGNNPFGRFNFKTQPQWQEPPALDKRINVEKYPELKQNQAKRAALVAESKSATPEKAEEIKKQVTSMDKETEKKTEEIIRRDFAAAPDLEDAPLPH